jgi:putative Mg2+ transporter-C (MgtC) family protein
MDIQQKIVLNIILAFIAGTIIGYDRERNRKPAGTRTQMLICVGSALLASISVFLKDFYYTPESVVRIDPARLMAQIVSGIGFVGAGVILKSKHRVIGVTTAATIWTTAAIGIAIGVGFYIPAAVATFFTLLLSPLARMQYRMGIKTDQYLLKIDKGKSLQVPQALSDLNIEVGGRVTKKGKVYITIYSSDYKNNLLESSLTDQDIDFDLEKIDPD